MWRDRTWGDRTWRDRDRPRWPVGSVPSWRFGVVLALGSVMLPACERRPPHSLVPVPTEVETGRRTFRLDASTAIALDDASDGELRRIAELWARPFRASSGLSLPISEHGALHLAVGAPGAPEGYRLDVDADGISVVGVDHAGLFYGLQTLSQLLPAGLESGSLDVGGGIPVRAVSIRDEPRFTYRGMHLDVARHFFEPDFVRRYIDLLARYKMNRFHWHLTDDQGWRIEIQGYPRLTEIGAHREETHVGHGDEPFRGDGRPYGGFYTQEEIREVVAYAQDRFVTIVPEIEMPGHARAALAAYPELACDEGPFEVARTWGVFDDVFCPTEETFRFLEVVLEEVAGLFPGEYVHIGGDEAPATKWEESDAVRTMMQRQGYFEIDLVRGDFLRRVHGILADNGKRMIGWDEILEANLPEDAAVMSWRGTIGGIEASRRDHDVVMTPSSHLYLDYYQSEDREREPLAIGGYLPLDTVYAYEPVPEPLRARDAARIVGAQANVWTEYMKTPEQVEYMLLPRMLAVAEVVWSPPYAKDFEDFTTRLAWHLERFDALGVDYRPLGR